jgi:hypothetical protein
MKTIINPKWVQEMTQKMIGKENIDVITGVNKCTQWLIVQLETRKYNYKVKNCGSGVKHITGTFGGDK